MSRGVLWVAEPALRFGLSRGRGQTPTLAPLGGGWGVRWVGADFGAGTG